MVERGQVLERMLTLEGPQGRLEGLWQGGGSGGIKRARDANALDAHDVLDDDEGAGRPVVFLPPHPRLGGNMDSPICAELVWTLGHRRHPTLRFNYAGVGASQGKNALPPLPPATPLTPAQLQPLVDDAKAAIAHMVANGLGDGVVVVGVSVGALVAARVAVEVDAVAEAVFVAPVVSVGAFDVGAVAAAGVPFRVYVGSADGFVDVDGLKALGCQPVVIEGANHTFSRGLPALAAAVARQLH